MKYLRLEQDGGPYPAVTMSLSRSYTTNEGAVSEPETVQVSVWWASQVAEAAANAVPDQNGYVLLEKVFLFEDLNIYAPNGSLYVYTVTEEKEQLGGYDTWAAEGKLSAQQLEAPEYSGRVSVGGLTARRDAAVSASFLNIPNADPSPIGIDGEKSWNDFGSAGGDVFGFRPDDPTAGLELTLERRANPQAGQSNGIGW